MEKLKQKLKENEGATFLQIVLLFLIGMVVFSIIFEFVRVKLVVANVRAAYEKAVRTVVMENYNETYAGFREEISVGGQFVGGPEGGGDEETPEWESLHDMGDVEEELVDLLGLEENGNVLVQETSGYSISNISLQVKDADESELERYEVDGSLTVSVQFSIAGIASSEVEIPIKIQTKYGENY